MKLSSVLKQCFDLRTQIFCILLMALTVLMSSMTANAGSDDLVVDFGTGSGLWRWMNNSSWQQLHGATAKTMVSGDLDGNGRDDVVIDFGTGSGLWRWMNNSSWQQLHSVTAKTMVSGDLDGEGGDIGRIWVHVSHMGNAVQTVKIGGVFIVPTAHMVLLDASGVKLTIEPWGCIYTGDVYGVYGDLIGLSYSAWAIDRVSRTLPTQEEICYVDYFGKTRCIPAWYPVDIPAGFQPVQYVAGCAIYLPFDFL